MTRLVKTYRLSTTGDESHPTVSVSADEEGTFTAVVSVFGNVDYQGDRVVPGAFDASLERLRAKGDPIPVVWSHLWQDPHANVGFAWPKDVRELRPGEHPAFQRGGLLVRGRFDIEKEYARQVYDLVKARRVTEWSFSYDTIREKKASDGANELLQLDLIEVGPTVKGANSQTATLSVKAATREAAGAMRRDPDLDLKSQIAEIGAEIGSKPWRVEERDGRFCVVKITDESTVACHDIREQAEAQVRALYAAEENVRGQSPNTMSEIELRDHLRRRHGNQIEPSRLEMRSLPELQAMHRIMHGGDDGSHKSWAPDVAAEAEALVQSVRQEKAREDRERADFDAAQLSASSSWAERAEREAIHEQSLRDRAAREQTDRERERQAEADAAAVRDEVSRTRDWRHVGPASWYAESGDVEPVPESELGVPEVRLTDATVAGLGESTGPIAVGYVHEETGRLAREAHVDRRAWTPYGDLVIDAPVPDKTVAGEGKTVRVESAKVDDEKRTIEKGESK
jgi:HK97 family phage prohead protease